MKSANDPRHQKRREIVKELFAESFTNQPNLDEITKNIMKEKGSGMAFDVLRSVLIQLMTKAVLG